MPAVLCFSGSIGDWVNRVSANQPRPTTAAAMASGRNQYSGFVSSFWRYNRCLLGISTISVASSWAVQRLFQSQRACASVATSWRSASAGVVSNSPSSCSSMWRWSCVKCSASHGSDFSKRCLPGITALCGHSSLLCSSRSSSVPRCGCCATKASTCRIPVASSSPSA